MKKSMIAILILLLVGMSGFGIYRFFNKDEAKTEGPGPEVVGNGKLISIRSSVETQGLIPIDATFELVTEGEITQKVIEDILVMEPNVPYQIEKKTDSLYTLKPESKLPLNKLVKFSFKNSDRLAGWAFQTVDRFRIKSSYPANESMNVDVSTGIEIEFTQPIEEGIKAFISVAPAIDYAVEIRGTKAVILPKSLEKDVLYVVTLAPGYAIDGEPPLEKTYQFSFSTGEVSRYYNSSTMSIELMTNSMPKRLPVSYYQDVEMQLTLYALADQGQYKSLIDLYLDKARYYKNPGTEFHLEALKPLLNEKVQPISDQQGSYLYLPEQLDKGYYLAQVDNAYTFFQVTDYTIYAEGSEQQILLFGVNTKNNTLLAEGEVRVNNEPVAKFDDQGVCIFKEHVKEAYYEIKTSDETVFVPLVHNMDYNWNMFYEAVSSKYQTFFYTDRPTYRPNDVINLYGTLHSKKGEKIKQVKVELFHSWLDSGAYFSKEVSLSDYNSFTVELPLEALEVGYYQLKIYEEGVLIGIKGISIEDYQLPEFQIDQKTDKEVIANGEAVSVTGQATYFDGTPLKNYGLSTLTGVDYYNLNSEGNIKTDQTGRFGWTSKPLIPYDNWRPVHFVLRTANQNAENMEIGDNSYVYLFPTDMSLRVQGDISGSKGHLDIETHTLAVPEDTKLFDNDYIALDQNPLDQPVWITVRESYYQKTSLGFTYDAIRKIQVEKFRYDYVEQQLLKQELMTIGGKGSFDFDVIKDRYYVADITTVDGKGNTIRETSYLSTDFLYGEPSSAAYFEEPHESYALGDTIRKSLKTPDSADLAGDKTLFITYQNAYLDHAVSEDATYVRTFTKDEIPNIVVKAIYYDGYGFKFSNYNNMCYLKLDDAERLMAIEVITEKDALKPGDETVIGIKTTVKGKPVAAEVVINVVDEAYYAIYEDYSNIRSELYALKYETGVTATYYPGYFNFYGMAEGGEGGASEAGMIRSEFKDVADFKVVHTNEKGEAELSVELPHNLTTWRVSAYGLTSDLEAGQGRGAVRVSLPFFIRVLTSPIYLAEETPAMVLRADGDRINGNEAVEYTLLLKSDDGSEQTVKAKGSAYSFTSIELGKLAAGNYRYIITGKSGTFTDAIEKDFSVVPSRVSFDAYRKGTLNQAYTVKNTDAPTQLTLWNTAALEYMDRLYSIIGTSNERLEWIIGQAEAQKLLYPSVEEGWQDLNALNLLPLFKDYTGGLKPLENAEADLWTTVQVVSLNQDYLSVNSARGYFNNIVLQTDATRADQLLALWGLACYGEPVLHNLKSIDVEGLKPIEKLYYASALEQIGDIESCYALYSGYTLIQAKDHALDEKYLMANLGARFENEKSAEEWFALALSEKPIENVYQLQEVKFLKSYRGKLPVAEVTYRLSGEEHSMILDDHQSQNIVIDSKSDFEIKDIVGDITVQENYKGNLNNADRLTDNTIQIRRTVSNENPKLSEIITVKIDIKLNVPKNGNYSLRLLDTVPSGFSLVDTQYTYGDSTLHFWPYSPNGAVTVTYRIRAKQTGQFILEPCVATRDNTKFIWTEPMTLTVSADE